jgi:hypothetical protein
MQIFNFDSRTGRYLSASPADLDPLDEDNWLVPAHATTIEPPEFNADTQLVRWSGTAWIVEDLPAPPVPPAPPTLSETIVAMRPELRLRRDVAINVLDGLQADALTDGDAVTAQAIKVAKQACRDLPALNVSAAVDEAGARALYLAEWRRIATLVPPSVRGAFAAVLA